VHVRIQCICLGACIYLHIVFHTTRIGGGLQGTMDPLELGLPAAAPAPKATAKSKAKAKAAPSTPAGSAPGTPQVAVEEPITATKWSPLSTCLLSPFDDITLEMHLMCTCVRVCVLIGS
jgi:hypothetical protein